MRRSVAEHDDVPAALQRFDRLQQARIDLGMRRRGQRQSEQAKPK